MLEDHRAVESVVMCPSGSLACLLKNCLSVQVVLVP